MPRPTQEKASPKRTPITTELLVDTAIDLIEADGLEALSMRRLADRFGIQAASVYWYVASKEHMLDLVVDRLLGLAYENVFVQNVEQRGIDGETPEQLLRRMAVAYRAFLLAHPDSAKVISSRLVVGPNLAMLDRTATRPLCPARHGRERGRARQLCHPGLCAGLRTA